MKFIPSAIRAADVIGITTGSNLRVKDWNGTEVLIGLTENSTVDQLLSMVYSSSEIRATKNGYVLNGGDMVSTGTVLKYGSSMLPVVVKGDATGDGTVNVSDALRIKACFLNQFHMDDLLMAAADVSEDGVVNATDYLQIKKYLLKTWNIYTNKNDFGKVHSLEIIKGGQTEYSIVYNMESERTAAYVLRDALLSKLGVSIPVKTGVAVTMGDKVILLHDREQQEIGNCGYAVEADGVTVNLYASGMIGFDKAIEQLVSDCVNKKTFSVPSNYFIIEDSNWESDYVLSGKDYNPDYNDGLFYNDKNDSVAYVTNAMWHMFGAIDDGQNLVYRFGNEPTWFEWISEKLAWSTDRQYVEELKQRVLTFPQTTTGYMWSWGTYPFWKVDDCYSIHYDGTFRYIASVYDIITWEGNTNFLYQTDPDRVSGDYADVDASYKRTVLDKTEACMDYILNYLNGSKGYIRLTKESTYLNTDGSKRFDYVKDTNTYCWNNTGKDGSSASNYWDNLCFGNFDGYSNALFFNALQSMSGIYRMLEEKYQDGTYAKKADTLDRLAIQVCQTFNELYWSDTTGRYIACIDSSGRVVDYGLTFHNFEIMKYGLADEQKARSILDWVDGKRIIAGENRTGSDIFSYAKIMELVPGTVSQEIAKWNLRLAAVTNTIAIDQKANQSKNQAWWHAPSGIDVWTTASYGKHLENGGYILYPVFYELMARNEYEGPQSTTQRLWEIAKVYEYNRLSSDAAATGSTNWLEGMVGEFPESGLVPTAYLYALVGLSAEYDGLHIAPSFNDVYEYMGVREMSYGGNTYAIEVNRNATCTMYPQNGTVNLKLHYTPGRFLTTDYAVTVEKSNGRTSTYTIYPDETGTVYISLNETNVTKITVAPILK